jgi:hypothetical protein
MTHAGEKGMPRNAFLARMPVSKEQGVGANKAVVVEREHNRDTILPGNEKNRRRHGCKEIMNMHNIRAEGIDPRGDCASRAGRIKCMSCRQGLPFYSANEFVVEAQMVHGVFVPFEHRDLFRDYGIFSSRLLIPIMQYEYAHDLSP